MTQTAQKTTLVSSTLSEISEKMPVLKQSIILEETRAPRQAQWAIITSAILICCSLVAIILTPYEHLITSTGTIVTTNKVHSIRPLFSGTIETINVHNGDLVKTNDVILSLDTHKLKIELEALFLTTQSLQVVADRLRAIGLNQEFDTGKYPNELEKMVSEQKAIYEMQLRNKEDLKLTLSTQLEQKRAQLALTLGQEHDLRQQMENAEQQRDVAKKLYEKKLGTGTDYRRAEESLSKLRQELANLINLSQEHRHQITEHEGKIIELDAKLRTDALSEMTKISQQLTQLHEKKIRLDDQIKAMDIKAPITGIIQGMATKKIGDDISGDMPIAQIIPLENLEATVYLKPRDALYVKQNQSVTILPPQALDMPRQEILGKVVNVADAPLKTESSTVIPITVALSKSFSGSDPKNTVLAPGTDVSVTIFTGSYSLWDNLVKPLRKRLQ